MDAFYCCNCRKNVPEANRVVHEARCKPIATPSAPEEPPEVIDLTTEFHSTNQDSSLSSNGWNCPKCTYLNHAERIACEVCSTARVGFEEVDFSNDDMLPEEILYNENSMFPATSSSSTTRPSSTRNANSWVCSCCTFENPSSTDACGMCSTTRPAAASYTDQLLPDINTMPRPRVIQYYNTSFTPARGGGGRNRPRPPGTSIASATLLGAGLGAGLALLNQGSVTRGALEGAGVGALGGLLMQTFEAFRTSDEDGRHPHDAAVGGQGFPGFFQDNVLEEMALRMAVAMGGLDELPPNNARRGLDENIVRNLPTRIFQPSASSSSSSSSSSSNDTKSCCSICLSSYEGGDEVKTLPCLHNYHAHCIDRWLQQSTACPVCKHIVH
ncbi:hypothetical protein EON65_33475 [archaeon]|nr:MAG: hypothetical protein EON65_33475 [archaeon]